MSAAIVAETFTVDIQILPSGDADIREEMAVRFAGGAGELVRQISFARADGIRFVSASADGRDVTPGSAGDVSLIVQAGDRLEARWQARAGSDETHALVLRYVAERVVHLETGRGSVRLEILNGPRTFAVTDARLTIRIPDSAVLYAGTGIAEAGWQVERVPSGITAHRRNLTDDESGTVVAELSVDPMTIVEPAWQARERSRDFLLPAFTSAGLFMLVVGAGILWIVRARYPRRKAATPEDERERDLARRGLRNGGLVTVVVGLVTALITWPFLDRLGISAMALPLSVVVVGLVFALVSRRWV